MIPQTAAPPPGTGGVQREIYCSSGFANSTPSFTRHPSPQFNTHSEHFMLCFVVYIIKSFSLPTCRPAPAGTFPITPVYRKWGRALSMAVSVPVCRSPLSMT
jgi:hypothetical protein